jgi:hypothetical protein
MVPFLLENGYRVTGVDRAPAKQPITGDGFRFIEADTTQTGDWQDAVNEADAVINLAGVSIFRRWTEKTKKLIYDSRILTTRNVVAAIPEDRETVLCSTSAVGFYGARGDEAIDESAAAGDDFLARISIDWEGEAIKAEKKATRVVLARFGIILGKAGGALGTMLPAFRLGLGGPLGSGNQWFPWVHIADLIRAHRFVLEQPDISGPVNFTAPNPVRNRDLAKSLGKALNRPAFFKVPGFVLRLAAGEFGEVLLNGQRVYPAMLLDKGFEFTYPTIEQALQETLLK